MLVYSLRWASLLSALAELFSTQGTIAIKTFAAFKVKSVVVMEAGENMAFTNGSLVERETCASRYLWPQSTGCAWPIVGKV